MLHLLNQENENPKMRIVTWKFVFILNAYNKHFIFIVYIKNPKLILYY